MNWRFVGGAAGIQLQRPPVMAPFDSYVKMLFFVQAVLVVIAVAIARYIQNSRIGRGLRRCGTTNSPPNAPACRR